MAPVGEKGVRQVRETQGPAPVNSDLTLYATLLGAGKTLERPLQGKKGYIHVIQTSGYNAGKSHGVSVRISGPGAEQTELKEGDGAYIFVGEKGNVLTVEHAGAENTTAEVLVFDLELL